MPYETYPIECKDPFAGWPHDRFSPAAKEHKTKSRMEIAENISEVHRMAEEGHGEVVDSYIVPEDPNINVLYLVVKYPD